jgi:nitrogen regulatory protein PII
MKMLYLVTDSEYEPHCLNMMKEKGVTGYTIVPEVLGVGRTGAKMGDRVHPGASILLLSVVPDEAAPGLLECIRGCVRDGKLCESTHAWVVPVEASVGF